MEQQQQPQKSALDLRDDFIITRRQFFMGQKTEAELKEAGQAYINAIADFKKRTGNKKLRVPTFAYLMRSA